MYSTRYIKDRNENNDREKSIGRRTAEIRKIEKKVQEAKDREKMQRSTKV
jgi:hypothetical protein